MTGIQPLSSSQTWTTFGANIQSTGLRMLPTPIFPDSILGFAYPALKLLTQFQSRGMEIENNCLVPPVHCITRAVQHLLVCGAVGTLVVPYWPSNVFWPFLFANAIQFQPYVPAYINSPDPAGIFSLGRYKDSLIGSDRFKSAVLAVRIGAKGP